MPDHRIRILLESACGTPLVSGTLFGQFCWTVLLHEGQDKFDLFLAALKDEPMIFSDAMPGGYVPIPLLGPSPASSPAPENMALNKELGRRQWVRWADFAPHRHQLTVERLRTALNASGEPKALILHRMPHNTIDRATGSTPESGGLFFLDEDWPAEAGTEMDVYVRSEWEGARIERLFAQMGKHGFGRDASTGRGRFRVLAVEEETARLAGNGNRWVSWSRGCAGPGMRTPRYRLYTHYGKLGSWWAGSEPNPFKYPITLWKPGATFAAEGPVSAFGRLLRGVHPSRPEVLHNALHFAIPYTEAAA